MKQYYQETVTDKSWTLLQKLKKDVQFVLIGGWAVYLYTKALKSKDIDIIIDYANLTDLESVGKIHKNERLLKYEVKNEEVDIDIYLPYYSNLGLPVEVVMKHTQLIQTFTVPQKEMLVATKLFAYQSRQGSAKGQKDKIDILSIIFLKGFDFDKLYELITKYDQKSLLKILKSIIVSTYEIKELGINRHQYARIKKEIMAKIVKN